MIKILIILGIMWTINAHAVENETNAMEGETMKNFFTSFFSKKEIQNCIYEDNSYSCQVVLNDKQIGDIFFSKNKVQFIIYKKRIAKGNFQINNIEEQVLYDEGTLKIRIKEKDIFSAKCSNDDFQKIIGILK